MLKTMDIQGKSVFLTGGARGIGRALMEALLAKGAKVLFCDVLEAEGRATETELKENYGENVIFRICDVSDAKQLTDTFETAVLAFGNVDVHVNNAAIGNEGKWEKMIGINQVGSIRGSLLAYEHMRKDKGGRGGVIVNVASMSGFLYGEFFNPVYTATKHALVAFTTGMANNPKMEGRGLRWCCLCTNAVETPLGQKKPEDVYEFELRGEFRKKYPRNFLTPSQVADAFIIQLQDVTNNGTVMKVAKKDSRPYHQMMVMDKSKPYYIDRMIYKDRVFMEPHK